MLVKRMCYLLGAKCGCPILTCDLPVVEAQPGLSQLFPLIIRKCDAASPLLEKLPDPPREELAHLGHEVSLKDLLYILRRRIDVLRH